MPKIAGWKRLEQQAERERAAKVAQRVPPEQQQQDKFHDLMRSMGALARFAPLAVVLVVLAVTTNGWDPETVALVGTLAGLYVISLVIALIVVAVRMRRR